ncbi:MAG: dTMP kinase [Acetivibrionales bacterium]|jgi:dTMP kinase
MKRSISKTANKYNRKKGVLIVFEGLSGSGKSLNARLLIEVLRDRGYDPVLTEWNSNKTIRGLVAWLDSRDILTSRIYSLLQWIGFFLDYFTVILPALRSWKIVIADRYVYTGMARDSANGAWKWPGRVIVRIVRRPDRIYFIDLPASICLERLKAKGKALFHTNKRIRENRLLKNKELYYLKKMRHEYNRLFSDTERLKIDEVLKVYSGDDVIEWNMVNQIYDTEKILRGTPV